MNPAPTDGAATVRRRTTGSSFGVLRTVFNGVAGTLRSVEGIGLALADWPSQRATTWINAAQVLTWTAFALVVLPNRGHFTYDQAYFYELSVRVAETLRPNAYGPFVSQTDPAALTPGGGLYLVYSIPFFFFRDPRIGVGWIIILSAGGLFLTDRLLVRLKAASSLRFALVSLLTWSLWHARFTDTFWNANLFLFSTPALLYAAIRNAQAVKPSAVWSVLFGLLSALSLQLHASGLLAVLAACLLWATQRPDTFGPRQLGLALCGLLIAYVPYVLVELRDGWINSRALRSAVLPGFDKKAVRASFVAYLLPASDARSEQLVDALSRGPWSISLAAGLSVAALLSLIGLCARFPSKMTAVLIILAVPLYFRLNGRSLYDHYIVSVISILSLPAAAGVAWLVSRSALRWVALIYLGVLVFVGIAVVIAGQQTLRPGNPWNGQTLVFQRERARQAIGNGGLVNSEQEDESALVQWVVARRLLGRSLKFRVGTNLCDVALRLSGHDPPVLRNTDQLFVPLGPNSVFVCQPDSK